VVLAYEATLPAHSAILDSQQHSDVLWIKPEELSQYATHLNSQIYF
jgi:hypothetical protein